MSTLWWKQNRLFGLHAWLTQVKFGILFNIDLFFNFFLQPCFSPFLNQILDLRLSLEALLAGLQEIKEHLSEEKKPDHMKGKSKATSSHHKTGKSHVGQRPHKMPHAHKMTGMSNQTTTTTSGMGMPVESKPKKSKKKITTVTESRKSPVEKVSHSEAGLD